METFEIARLDHYFRAVREVLPPAVAGPRAVLITHLLRERPSFVRAVDQVAAAAAVLPKPKSADRDAVRAVGRSYSVDSLSREQFADPDSAVAYLEQRAAGQPVVRPYPRSACNATKSTTSPGFLPPKSSQPSWPNGSPPQEPS